jgi:hypothetical protein
MSLGSRFDEQFLPAQCRRLTLHRSNAACCEGKKWLRPAKSACLHRNNNDQIVLFLVTGHS